ncbi:MAG: DUF368 domain-containing protein [Ruminococcaceae bacterium]|nr:DUF368 domain-containing protein [Oscillospiraceae bacterium]
MKKDSIVTMLKGLWIGGTMTVPGVSGGSMAMILGIYDRLISAVNNAIKFKKESILFLIQFLIGAVVGLVLFSKAVPYLLTQFPFPMHFFFIGCVAGGIPMIFRAAKVTKFSWKIVVYLLFGILLVTLIAMIPKGLFVSKGGFLGILLQLIGGILIAIALVLPGISVSHMLYMLGLYETVTTAVGNLDILSVLPLGIGVVGGILLTAKVMEKAMNRAPQFTYLVVLGFLLGSLPELFPMGISVNLLTIIISLIMAVAGFFFIYLITKKEELISE